MEVFPLVKVKDRNIPATKAIFIANSHIAFSNLNDFHRRPPRNRIGADAFSTFSQLVFDGGNQSLKGTPRPGRATLSAQAVTIETRY